MAGLNPVHLANSRVSQSTRAAGVLIRIARGKTNRDIADILGPRTE